LWWRTVQREPLPTGSIATGVRGVVRGFGPRGPSSAVHGVRSKGITPRRAGRPRSQRAGVSWQLAIQLLKLLRKTAIDPR
jgi:hypothetical protein